jgi:hypothetical protein
MDDSTTGDVVGKIAIAEACLRHELAQNATSAAVLIEARRLALAMLSSLRGLLHSNPSAAAVLFARLSTLTSTESAVLLHGGCSAEDIIRTFTDVRRALCQISATLEKRDGRFTVDLDTDEDFRPPPHTPPTRRGLTPLPPRGVPTPPSGRRYSRGAVPNSPMVLAAETGAEYSETESVASSDRMNIPPHPPRHAWNTHTLLPGAAARLAQFRRASASRASGDAPWEVEAQRRQSLRSAREARRQSVEQRLAGAEPGDASAEARRRGEMAYQEQHRRRQQTDRIMREAMAGRTVKRTGLLAVGDPPERGGPAAKSGRTFFAAERRRKDREQFIAAEKAQITRREEEALREKLLGVTRRQDAARRILAWFRHCRARSVETVATRMTVRRRREAMVYLRRFVCGACTRVALFRLRCASRAAVVLQRSYRLRLCRLDLRQRQQRVQLHLLQAHAADVHFLDLILRGVRMFQARSLLRRRRQRLREIRAERISKEAVDEDAMITSLETLLGSIERNIDHGFGTDAAEEYARKKAVREAAESAAAETVTAIAGAAVREAHQRNAATCTLQRWWRGEVARFEAMRRQALWTLDVLQSLDPELAHRRATRARAVQTAAVWAESFAVGRQTRSENL